MSKRKIQLRHGKPGSPLARQTDYGKVRAEYIKKVIETKKATKSE